MTGADLLVDPRFGPVTSVAPLAADPGLPATYVCYRAQVGRTRTFAGWSADPVGWGSGFGDHAAARAAAVGEAVERYCGHAVPSGLRTASAAELRRDGLRVLAPDVSALFSARQYATPGFPFVAPDDRTVLPWVRGTDLRDGADTWVPAAAVYLDLPQDPPLQPLSYAGVATGTGVEDAAERALLELVERDATAVWWASGATTRRIDDDGAVTGLLGATRLRVTLVEVPSQVPLPVVAALVHDPVEDLVAVGCSCRRDPWAAAVKAVEEAVGGLRLARELEDPTSETWRSVAQGSTPSHTFLPYRADRRYLESAGQGYRRLVDLPALAQLAQDPAYRDLVLPRLRPTRTVRLADVPAAGPEALPDLLERHGFPVVTVDVTTSDVRPSGLVVLRALVPGLVGNAPPAFPLLGPPRLLTVPSALDWDRRPTSVDDLFTPPFPLA